jgi:hypothetical protein
LSQAHDFKIYAKVSDSQIIQKMEPGALDKFIGLTIEELKEVASNESNRLNMPNSEPTKKTEETNK